MKRVLFCLMFFGIVACDKDSKKATYEFLLSDADAEFVTGNYAAALQTYLDAQALNPGDARAYSGAGWCHLKLDDLTSSANAFNSGSSLANVSADLFAGWSFVLRAQEDFSGSNAKSDSALARDPAWQFGLIPSLDYKDLHLLRAGNYFLLGLYTQSKAEVVILDASFASVDVTTDSGRAELAQKIEDLKSLTKFPL
jgi:tetratricopeptide (TPR) repeat protein